MIPVEYLSKMDGHCVQIEGVELKVKVADLETGSCTDSLLDAYIKNIKSGFKTGPRVVGVDIISRVISSSSIGNNKSLVLCVGAANCLIVHLSCYRVPEVLLKFLEDSSICFVGATSWPTSLVRGNFNDETATVTRGIGAGHLAFRVLRDYNFSGLSLEDISRKVGISYKGLGPMGKEIRLDDHKPTYEQVKVAVNDAYAYYRIGHKLLSSL